MTQENNKEKSSKKVDNHVNLKNETKKKLLRVT